MTTMALTVNGAAACRDVPDNTLLVTYLRESLGLTGTHVGCDTTQCGACTVRLDGQAVKSCTVLVAQVQGSAVTTIEGLARGGVLHPVQQAFKEQHALQCGFCTPGMVMAAVDLIEHHPGPLTPEFVRSEMDGNLCRCTGYHNIVKAIVMVSAAPRPAAAPAAAVAG
jgi:carbon-monoxide dehydrogenase small subunit